MRWEPSYLVEQQRGRTSLPMLLKSVQKLSVFKYQNSRFEKIAEILFATKELLLATVGILDDPPTLWTRIIWCADDGWAVRCPNEPFGIANHFSCISLPTPLGAAVARQ